MTALEPLLELQDHDLALDRLHHRLAALPEREALAAAEARVAELCTQRDALQSQRDDVAREEQRLEDEASSLGDQAMAAEAKLYSGEVVSPRELQALQADVQQLRRHQRSVEDRQLVTMEKREPLDEQLAGLQSEIDVLEVEATAQREALTATEGTISADVATEEAARGAIAAGVDDDLLAVYERCREKANGVGAARLVGMTCQGCHLSIPATEVDRIRTAPAGTVEHCDNCGCILIP